MNTHKEKVQGLILADKWDLCYAAHSNTSFSPEKRATMYVTEYSKQLEEDLKELGESQGNYRQKYVDKFTNWMGAKGRCMSSMITGPANFPVRRAQKANNSERNHYDNFQSWRVKYFAAVNRVPTKSPEDELEIAERRLEELVNYQLELKEINVAVRKFKSDDINEIYSHLIQLDYQMCNITKLDLRGGKYKIPSYVLTNNNAKIKSTQSKVKIMQTRIDRKNTWEDIKFEGGYITIEDDRLKIFHDEKPEKEIIQEIKKNGYRWSPHWSCWCRKHTGNALYGIKYLSFINKATS